MSSQPITDRGRLLFAAGFVFGVGVTLLILGMVVASIGGGQGPLGVSVSVLILASVLFTALVGSGLFLLAFPENRLEVPVSFAESDEEPAGTSEK